MSRTRKSQAAHYLTLLITVAVLSVAMTPATQSVPVTRGSDVHATLQATPNQARVRYNGKIVFISDRLYKGLSVWSMNPDGSSPTRLTDDKSRSERLPSFVPVYDSGPRWSPDGTKIAFISNRDYLFALYVMNADGSNAQLVTDKVIDAGEPAWSPDGGKIAFSGGVRGTIGFSKPSTDIYVINVDGSGLAKLTQGSGLNGSPTWLPDGKQIAFVSNRDLGSKSTIWVMNADGSNPRILPISQNGFSGGQPAWSPDGAQILFIGHRACRADVEWAIYVMNADGSNTRLLTNDPNSCGIYSSPRWSPDGTKIVASFRAHPKNDVTRATQIIVMNADGSNQINISNRDQNYLNTGPSNFTDVHADWQPLPAPPNFASSVVGFSAPSYTVNENAGSVAITVTRTGNLNDVASCVYVTSEEGFKIGGPDTLRFARGESSKTISIAFNVWNRSLKIVLSDNEGNATFVGGIKEATVTILRK
jgi:Tol biopolymer transport system component